MKNHPKGFTLLELIIVIGILAILGSVSVLVLNPVELFRQARDATRVNDLSSLGSAVTQYISTISAYDLNGAGHVNTACAAGAGGMVYAYAAPTTNSFTLRAGGYQVAASHANDGTGWLPVPFSNMDSAPIATLPIDPVNTGDYIYRYACDQASGTFELNGKFESAKYTSGAGNKMTKDGGDTDDFFEIGSEPGLDL